MVANKKRILNAEASLPCRRKILDGITQSPLIMATVQQTTSPPPPKGKQRFKWLGPAFIWMLSAAGSGELLFTPRIAAQYGYTLVWAIVLAVAMKWVINREIGRYTVCTGASFFMGISSISAKSKRLLWLIILPQLVVAVSIIAGLTGAAATAFVVAVDVPLLIPSIALVALTTAIILVGQYKTVEKVTTITAITVSLAVMAAAVTTGPDGAAIAKGFTPTLPQNVKFDEVLPWIGFMLAGAAGLMWFSYWTKERGYGAASLKKEEPLETKNLSAAERKRLKAWIGHATIANTLAVAGALIIAFAFLILGTELLKPKGLVPEENKVAETLGQLLDGIWGRTGFWFMIAAVFVTFTSTMLSCQDGFGRMFSDGASILLKKTNVTAKWKDPKLLHKFFLIVLLCLFPAIVYAIVGEPVGLLKLAGAIEACHIPVVAFLALYLNRKTLHKELRPGILSSTLLVLAGVFFTVFAVVFLLQLTGVLKI
jgi:Mn2+/Fe2+ NRAMP family transporter